MSMTDEDWSEIAREADAREEGRREGYAACTADAVALLSGGRTLGGEAITSSRHAAEVIRRNDHVGAAEKGKKK